MTRSSFSRRRFLKSSAATSVAAMTPCFFNSTQPISSEFRCLNDKAPIGLIGAGGMGTGNMKAASEYVDVVAIADVDSGRAGKANMELSEGKADVYEDYRSVLERDDIKIVHIATPDHWHTKPLIEAMLAGKDVYCEKPLTLTIDEGKLIRKVQKETGRVVQVGTQQRSQFRQFTKAVAVAAEGRLGKIKRIQCAIGAAPVSKAIPVAEVPKELNWDMWLGPAPQTELRNGRETTVDKNGKKKRARRNNFHYEFRWWYEYSGGKLTDWGAHHIDIAMWALAANGQSTNIVSIDGTAKHPVEFKDGVALQKDRYNTANEFMFTAMTDEGVEIVIRHDTDNGCLIEGEKGRIFVNRKKLVGKPIEELKDNPLPKDAVQKVYKGLPMESQGRVAHWLNFLHCHKERIEPISDVHSHMTMLNVCHLAGITARLGRKINWDAKTETIVGDELANSMLARPYREGYEIEMNALATSQ
ncbi:Gfo/Idh/MocA family oxidoreductase [Mariniblastus fucicola]|uniref:Inositol 2-dehydrogenase n=1 Tax=Mariniblastus fucicola TaxID=980251 RepID=A0A5B9PDU6_9BACT|nr:Gfo/Idh/MocA family oxidoreductase [Mariniblastus fucicola]QEG24877.1 Inositol 2-dehydrogenase [Mariniblastus fucicola]